LAAVSLLAAPLVQSCDFGDNVLAGPNIVFVVQPATTKAGVAIAPGVQVELQYSSGTRVEAYEFPVVVHLQDGPSGAVLGGTTSRPLVNGRAVFNDLSVSQPFSGYRLSATSGGLTGSLSAAFTISP